jgi:hypothetical protein
VRGEDKKNSKYEKDKRGDERDYEREKFSKC